MNMALSIPATLHMLTISNQNSTGVEVNLQFVLAEKQSMQRLPMLQPPMAQ